MDFIQILTFSILYRVRRAFERMQVESENMDRIVVTPTRSVHGRNNFIQVSKNLIVKTDLKII